jgi:hypothetical protein
MNHSIFQYATWTVLLMGWGLSAELGAQEPVQQYQLVAPQAGTTSTATRTADRLEITAGDGEVTRYAREPRLDPAGDAWLAYFDRPGRQVVLWPRSNRGPFQIGTVQGVNIDYRESQMEIRPVATTGEQVNQRVVLPERELTDRNRGLRDDPARPDRVNNRRWSGNQPGTNEPGDWRQWFGNAASNSQLRPSPIFENLHAGEANDASAQLLRLAAGEPHEEPWLLARNEQSGLGIAPITSAQEADWWVAPAGMGYVRLETYDRGRVFAVSTTRTRGLILEPLAQDTRQLWQVRYGRHQSRYVLESAFHPGWCLTQTGTGVALQPIAFVPQQLWLPLLAPLPPAFEPFWNSVSREVHANPPLAPAELQLVNSHRNALFVLLGDTRNSQPAHAIRIEANDSVILTLDRDPGGTLVETFEIRSPTGIWERQQLVTSIPPTAYYDVSVYEEFLQSIAIDRTGKSPNPIEDVNYVPRSIGWFPLPAGAELPARGSLDAYQRARQANNPGAVRRMDPRLFHEPEPSLTPAEALLKEFQSRPRRSF